MVALVFEGAFEFLQAVAAEIIGDAKCTLLFTPFNFQVLQPAEKVAGFGYLTWRELANRIFRCLRIAIALCAVASGRFTFSTPQDGFTAGSA